MALETKLKPKVKSTKLHAQGKWLTIECEDLYGISSNMFTYSHLLFGTASEVTLKGTDRDFVQELYDKLGELLTTWKISS
jgi:hypothetical protein